MKRSYTTEICACVAIACGGVAGALPEGWTITEFAAPPIGEYPTVISAAANGDGVADENKVLVKGFGWGIGQPRGADHTTNGLIGLRDVAGQVSQIKRPEVMEEKHLPQSMMPSGLANPLSIGEFTDPIEYLVSLKNVGG